MPKRYSAIKKTCLKAGDKDYPMLSGDLVAFPYEEAFCGSAACVLAVCECEGLGAYIPVELVERDAFAFLFST